jgi:hypothetical protein
MVDAIFAEQGVAPQSDRPAGAVERTRSMMKAMMEPYVCA